MLYEVITKRGRGALGKTPILVAVENRDKKAGFMAAELVKAVNKESVRVFCQRHLKGGQQVRTDAFPALNAIGEDHIHDKKVTPPEQAGIWLPLVHIVIGNLKTFLNGTFHGVTRRYLQEYIGEYCYRFNRRITSYNVCYTKLLRHHSGPRVDFNINPGSRQVLENVVAIGGLMDLIKAGAKVHQSGCMGCIGMGQAPGTGQVSLRTFPRNFPGRSGTKGDKVYLCSPETAAAAALKGVITDPRLLGRITSYNVCYTKLLRN